MGRDIKRGIIHCSATMPEFCVTAEDTRKLHTLPKGESMFYGGFERNGKGWSDIGYHYFIGRDGKIEGGRDIEVMGAHVYGENEDSVGICMAGGVTIGDRPDCNFTRQQWHSLDIVCKMLESSYPGIVFSGHRDYSRKACPTFDVHSWRYGGEGLICT